MAILPITDDELASFEAMIDAADFGILRLNLNDPRYIEELKPGYLNGGPAIADVGGPRARAELLANAPGALKLMIGEVRRLRAKPTEKDHEEAYRLHLEAAKLLAKAGGHDVYLIRIGPGSFGRATTHYAIQISNDGYRPRELITPDGLVFECPQLT